MLHLARHSPSTLAICAVVLIIFISITIIALKITTTDEWTRQPNGSLQKNTTEVSAAVSRSSRIKPSHEDIVEVGEKVREIKQAIEADDYQKIAHGYQYPLEGRNTDGIPGKGIVFLKTKKAGSSTISQVLQRSAFKRNQLVAWKGNLNFPYDYSFDMWVNHSPFNASLFRLVPQANFQYVSVLRDPGTRTRSQWTWRPLALKASSAVGKECQCDGWIGCALKGVRNERTRLCLQKSQLGLESQTLWHLGFDVFEMYPRERGRNITEAFTVKHERLRANLLNGKHLYLVMERMEESLVVLRHAYNLTLDDIVSFPKKVGGAAEQAQNARPWEERYREKKQKQNRGKKGTRSAGVPYEKQKRYAARGRRKGGQEVSPRGPKGGPRRPQPKAGNRRRLKSWADRATARRGAPAAGRHGGARGGAGAVAAAAAAAGNEGEEGEGRATQSSAAAAAVRAWRVLQPLDTELHRLAGERLDRWVSGLGRARVAAEVEELRRLTREYEAACAGVPGPFGGGGDAEGPRRRGRDEEVGEEEEEEEEAGPGAAAAAAGRWARGADCDALRMDVPEFQRLYGAYLFSSARRAPNHRRRRAQLGTTTRKG